MHNIVKDLLEKFEKGFAKAFPELKKEELHNEVVQSTQDIFGDYQCNSCMKLAKTLKQNPRSIAEKVIKNVEKKPLIKELEVAGPGFINITLNPAFISETVQSMLIDERLGLEKPEKKERIIVDFSSPNIAKELHVGHLRSTIIGDSIARIFEFLGHDVLRLNHIGDWGTSFGMLIAYLKEKHKDVLTGAEKTDLKHLVSWYKASKKLFDDDPDFKKKSRIEVVALQSGESASIDAWNIICDISRKAYREIYDLLDVKIVERGESFYNPVLPELINDLESKGLIKVSDGAKCIFLDEFKNRSGDPMPLMIQKSDGGFGYDTTDIAAMRQRVAEEKANRIIIITDAGQSTHFQMIKSAAIKANYLDPRKVRFDHVPFGLVLGPDGKKFKTRSGETEKLIDLIYNAIEKAKKIIAERKPEMDENERDSIASSLGIGAIKYADLSCHRQSDYTFSYDRMLRFEGNTAAFLIYSYVRIAGIKRKIQADIDTIKKEHKIILEHPSEIALGLHLLQFVEALEQVTNELLPNRLTDYLYNLSDRFNAFYRDCRVENSPHQNSRLLLSEIAAQVLKQGLNLLGVKTVKRM